MIAPLSISVTYTTNTQLLDKKVIKKEEDLFYEIKYIGWFKSIEWAFQEEFRYIVSLRMSLDKLHILNNLPHELKDQFIKELSLPEGLKCVDLLITDETISSMELLTSPTFEDEEELNSLLNQHHLSIPISRGKIRMKW